MSNTYPMHANSQKYQKLELSMNGITIYINSPPRTGSHLNSKPNRQTEQTYHKDRWVSNS